jgi:hypothetical protein
MKLIDISTKKYPNTFTMVDDEDFDWLNQWKWLRNKDGYAARNVRGIGYILAHREILGTPLGLFTDHINGNRLDNQRTNLRNCTHTENMQNRPKPPHGLTSIFKGVYWYKCRNRWRSKIKCNGRTFSVGYFATETEAARAYDAKALALHGEYARLNFPAEI